MMRQKNRGWAALIVAGLFVATPGTSTAQGLEAAITGGRSEEPPVVTPADVQDALLVLLGDAGSPGEPVTTADPEIAPAALSILLEPMRLSEIRVEIDGWDALFGQAVAEQAEAELALFAFTEAQAAEAETGEAAAGDPAAAAQEDDEGALEISPEHQALIDRIGALRAVATGLADRLRITLDAFEAKGGDPAKNAEIRAYIADVSGVEVDVSNVATAMLTIREWATAEDGGLRLARNSAIVIGALLAGLAFGQVIGLVVSAGLQRTELSSRLLAKFARVWVGRVGALAGLLIGLSWIGTNMTPILAALGATGFILAFALQNTISNFASGLLIMFQRPFDSGDEIEAAGITGQVDQVSLFSTHLSTAENRKVIVPNNMIWDDVIVNSTGAPTRRLQIEIEVNAEDHGLEDSEEILMGVMNRHPDVLDDPAPDLKLSAMTGESLTFTCWPWVETVNKDRVRWELVSQFSRELTVLKGVTKSGAAQPA